MPSPSHDPQFHGTPDEQLAQLVKLIDEIEQSKSYYNPHVLMGACDDVGMLFNQSDPRWLEVEDRAHDLIQNLASW